MGSNDVAYAARKLRGLDPAGVSVDEIIDDLAHLLKIEMPRTASLEARLEVFSGAVVDKEFSKLSDKRKREIIESMNFDKHHRDEIIDKIINKREMLLPVLLPLLTGSVGAEVMQGLIISIIAPFIGVEAAKQILVQIVSKFPVVGAWLGPLVIGAGAGWLIWDITGPASRKTIPLMLYLGVLCLRDGLTPEASEIFIKNGLSA